MTGALGVNNPDPVPAHLGANILDGTSWTAPAGWSGDFDTGFTVTGPADPLTRVVGMDTGKTYTIKFSVSGLAGAGQAFIGATFLGSIGSEGDYQVSMYSPPSVSETLSFSVIAGTYTVSAILIQEEIAEQAAPASPIHVKGDVRIVDGDLLLGNAAVAETPVASHTLIVKDVNGVAYKLLCVPV